MDLTLWMPLLVAGEARSRGRGLAEPCLALGSPDLLERLLRSPEVRTRRWAIARVLARVSDAGELGRILDGVDEAAVARALAIRLAGIIDDDGLGRLLRDRRVSVRRAAWEQVVAGRLPDLDLRRGLLDAAASVRALAQRAARARGFPAGAAYLDAPTGTALERRRRLLGLAAWGAEEALQVALSCLDDPDPRLRVAAIGVLARRADRAGDLLVGLLRGRRGAELRAAARPLLSDRVRLGEDDLALLRGGDAERRVVAWRLGRVRGRWERLLANLLALDDEHLPLRDGAREDLACWCGSVLPWAGPPPARLRGPLERAVTAAEHRGHDVRSVRWVLDT